MGLQDGGLLQTELVTAGQRVSAPREPGSLGGVTGTGRPRETSPLWQVPPPPAVRWVWVALTLTLLFINFCRLKFDPGSVAGTRIWATLLILATCRAAEHLPASLLSSENAGIVHPNHNLAVIICLY